MIDLKKHPHARGEDSALLEEALARGETPPRTWGRPFAPRPDLHSKRNTPTHVGKTHAARFDHPVVEKHPHARGEDRLNCIRCTIN